MEFSHKKNIRLYELALVLPFIPGHSKVLEIGAGAGWQARKLNEHGFDVTAIDIEGSLYEAVQEWPIIHYDGFHIPFPDNYFDVVFSSNVLEHIYHIGQFQAEIQRVLRPQGVAIHILPSGTWRFWTNITHYIYSIKYIINNLSSNRPLNNKRILAKINEKGAGDALKRIMPVRHGVIGNPVTEIYYFSKFRWQLLFNQDEWIVNNYLSNRLLYTGYSILNANLSVKFRHYISYILGSSCNIFLLMNNKGS